MEDREQYEAEINGKQVKVEGSPRQLRLVSWTSLEPRENFELSIGELSVLDQVNGLQYRLVLVASSRGLTTRIINTESVDAKRGTP